MIDAETSVPQRPVWGVGALLLAASDALWARLGACTVRGELAGFSRASSGHCYFSLKDGSGTVATLRCAMFRRAASLLDFAPRDGQQVELRGRLSVYESRGELQFIAESMHSVGAGSLYEEFLRLKARLEAQGLFDAARKRPIPRFPRRLGVVTSLAGAALHDVLVALQRRAPQVPVIVYPSGVQGAEAPLALVAALASAARRREVDCLLLCRGGGSIEDLWAFNDERVVRAIAASPIPLICGVGHETDLTLADLAADLRAATPTAAAELAVPARDELLSGLAHLAQRARRPLQRRIEGDAQRLDRCGARLARPAQLLVPHGRNLASLHERLRRALRLDLKRAWASPAQLQARLQRARGTALREQSLRSLALQQRLEALDPQRVLARGYAWICDDDQRAVVSVSALQPGQAVTAVWSDGRARVQVLQVTPDTPRR